jgi:starvation-inducible DNA-binding protein
MEMNLGLTDQGRSGSMELLNALLADEYVLYTKTRNYHWNVTGSDFGELHAFLEAQYKELEERTDAVAERVRALGGRAAGSLREFLDASRLQESSGALSARDMLAHLLEDHESIVRQLRLDIHVAADRFDDQGTSDLLTEWLGNHEKSAWMLRSYLQEK